MAAKASQTGLMALWKKGWIEIPEVMGATCMLVFGLGAGAFALKRHYAMDGDNKPYKAGYTVYRPDDPRVKLIRQ